VATRYAFVHALYRHVAYQRLGEGQRLRLHQRLGRRLEVAYGAGTAELAAELAEHFVKGQETQRAVVYLRQAAETAARRYAQREVGTTLRRALELLSMWPDNVERAQ
jgi:predicted ATPase